MRNQVTKEEIENHLADMSGFLTGLYMFGIIPNTHRAFRMLEEMATKNKKFYDRISADGICVK